MGKNELQNLIIYTGVFYQEKEIYKTRSQIWFKTFDKAARLGIKVVVRNDGGLPEEMLQRIKDYKNITIVEKTTPNTLGGGRREALQKAIEIADKEHIENPIFLWTESEKDNLITKENLLEIIKGIREGANIIVPDRGEKAWEQLPRIQRWLEKRAQKKFQEILKKKSNNANQENLDAWFGPQAFDKLGASYLLKYNSDGSRIDLWDALVVPLIEAANDGIKIRSAPVDFLYNKKQISVETGKLSREISIKRIEQYTQILKELGDPKWEDFFRDAKIEIERTRELNKDVPNNREEVRTLEQSLVKKFFKLR